jgi:hypothetical protein
VFIVRENFIAHDGESDVKQHDSSALHIDMTLRLVQSSENNSLTSFFVKEGTSEKQAVIASGLTLCYHNVEHSLSYSRYNCNTKTVTSPVIPSRKQIILQKNKSWGHSDQSFSPFEHYRLFGNTEKPP